MGSTSIPSASFFSKMHIKSLPLVCAAKNAQNSMPKMKIYNANLFCSISQVMHSQKACFKGHGSIRKAHMEVACGAKDSEPREEHSALETVLKLYEGIKNRNIYELSDIIAEECLCVSNFVSAFQLLLGKKQVLSFFSYLMKNLGNNIEFVVQQTLDDGMVVGVSWKLEWSKVPLPLGKGFSFYMCHVYQGKVMIKNVEIFMEPILRIEPPRLVSLQTPISLGRLC
ncbi:hypothetical protein Pfo_013202 [Paulownia fortunei]|nr:hypothetical protein Pfo_013202 [Paulownia fortunei]